MSDTNTIDVDSGGICVGYGGLEIAVAAALHITEPRIRVNHRWFAEFDGNASTVLAHHWPDVPNLGDVTKVDWSAHPPVRIFAGGIPCQPFSSAGKRAGSLDERDLWPVRKTDDQGRARHGAVDAIDTSRPDLVVIENVAGLLTAEDGMPFGVVVAELTARGYTVSWTTVGACKVGAAHHRHRVYIAATLADVPAPTTEPDGWLQPDGRTWARGQASLFGGAAPVKWAASGLAVGDRVWSMPVETCGFTSGVAALPTPRATDVGTPGRRAGEGWRPPLSEVVLHRMPACEDPLPTPTANDGMGGPGNSGRDGGMNLRMMVTMLPTPRASDGEKGGPNQRGSSGDLMLSAAVQPGRFGAYESAVRRQEALFGQPVPEPTEPGRNGKPRLAPAFPEWMMGLPAGWITDLVPRKPALKLAGNGVVWQAAAYALTTLPTFRAAVDLLTRERVELAASTTGGAR